LFRFWNAVHAGHALLEEVSEDCRMEGLQNHIGAIPMLRGDGCEGGPPYGGKDSAAIQEVFLGEH
jgi:hypothetical protein